MFQKVIDYIRQIPPPTDKTFLEVVILILLLIFCIGACAGCGVSTFLPPVVESPPVNDWKPLVATQMGYACMESAGCEDTPQIAQSGETAGFVARLETPEY